MKVPVRIYSCCNPVCRMFGWHLEEQYWPAFNNDTKKFLFPDVTPCVCGTARKVFLEKAVESSGWVLGVHPDNPKIDMGGGA